MMKKLLYTICLMVPAFTGFAQDAFEKGNQYYNSGRFAEAAASYEAILKAEKESAEVYFNLANAYYKLDSIAPAIYNYEKALQLAPSNHDVQANLAIANAKVKDDIDEVAQGGFSKFTGEVAGMYHYDTWAWIAVGFSIGFLLLFCGYYFGAATLAKRIFFVGMSVALVLMAVSLLAAFFAKGKAEKDRPAIIFASLAVVKEEPSAAAQDAIILHEGTKVYIDDEQGSWRKITLADDTTGWIEAGALKELR